MSKRMTVMFDDDRLYTAVKVEAARSGRHAKDIVAEALREWLEAREDEESREEIDTARGEWERDGGVEAGEFFGRVERGRSA